MPSNLIRQWLRKLDTDFTLPHVFWNNTKTIPDEDGIVLTSYDVALKYSELIKERDWDLVIFDEAQVDVDAEKEIEELTNSYNFNILTSCKFKLRLLKEQA